MNFPGFTAETSLYRRVAQHRELSDGRSRNQMEGGRIEPQSPAAFLACYLACRALGITRTIIPRDCVDLCLPYLDTVPVLS